MLCDATIRSLVRDDDIVIKPLPQHRAFQPASVDLRLGSQFWLITSDGVLSLRPVDDVVTLEPGDCVLGHTEEWIGLPADIVGRVEGKSTWGRRFLMVHSTAGFIDPGFTGQITLELKNISPRKIELRVGVAIAQISFERLDKPAARPYGHPELNSHYQGQTGATVSAP